MNNSNLQEEQIMILFWITILNSSTLNHIIGQHIGVFSKYNTSMIYIYIYICIYIYERETSVCMCYTIKVKQKTQRLFDEFSYSFNT